MPKQQQKHRKPRSPNLPRARTAIAPSPPPPPATNAPPEPASIPHAPPIESLAEYVRRYEGAPVALARDPLYAILRRAVDWDVDRRAGAEYLLRIGSEVPIGSRADDTPVLAEEHDELRAFARSLLARHAAILFPLPTRSASMRLELGDLATHLEPLTDAALDFFADPQHTRALHAREEQALREFLERAWRTSPSERVVRGLVHVGAFTFFREHGVREAIPVLFEHVCDIALRAEQVERLYDRRVLVDRCEAHGQTDVARMVIAVGSVLRGLGAGYAQRSPREFEAARTLLELIAMHADYYRHRLLPDERPTRSQSDAIVCRA